MPCNLCILLTGSTLTHSLKRKSAKYRNHELLTTSNKEMQTDFADNCKDPQVY